MPQPIVFKNHTWQSPIRVYLQFFGKKYWAWVLALCVLPFMASAFYTAWQTGKGILWFWAIGMLACVVPVLWGSRKPRFLISETQLVDLQNGFIKPKIIAWRDVVEISEPIMAGESTGLLCVIIQYKQSDTIRKLNFPTQHYAYEDVILSSDEVIELLRFLQQQAA